MLSRPDAGTASATHAGRRVPRAREWWKRARGKVGTVTRLTYAGEYGTRRKHRHRRRAAAISREQLAKLHASVRQVLKEAIALGGSSISDYVDANGDEGFFQLQHRVYGREGEPCLVCKTPIKRVLIAGRSSHYCPKCQK